MVSMTQPQYQIYQMVSFQLKEEAVMRIKEMEEVMVAKETIKVNLLMITQEMKEQMTKMKMMEQTIKEMGRMIKIQTKMVMETMTMIKEIKMTMGMIQPEIHHHQTRREVLFLVV